MDTYDAENEEDKEAEQQHVAQHGQRVQQQGDQDAHTCRRRKRVKTRSAQHNPSEHSLHILFCGSGVTYLAKRVLILLWNAKKIFVQTMCVLNLFYFAFVLYRFLC